MSDGTKCVGQHCLFFFFNMYLMIFLPLPPAAMPYSMCHHNWRYFLLYNILLCYESVYPNTTIIFEDPTSMCCFKITSNAFIKFLSKSPDVCDTCSRFIFHMHMYVYLCICVYPYMCAGIHVSRCIVLYVCVTISQLLISATLMVRWSLLMAYTLLKRLGWLASESQETACICIPITGIISMCYDT